MTENVSASTHNYAPAAILFLYRYVMRRNIGDVIRAGKPERRPVVMTREEVKAALCTIQELLGHRDVNTTMRYTHLPHRGPAGVRSPLDGM